MEKKMSNKKSTIEVYFESKPTYSDYIFYRTVTTGRLVCKDSSNRWYLASNSIGKYEFEESIHQEEISKHYEFKKIDKPA